MNKTEIAITKAHQKTFKAAAGKSVTCKFPGCNNRAINSHILQKKGALKKIASNDEVYEFKIESFKRPIFFFDSIGWNKSFSFPCFCNIHDSDLFGPIETEETVPYDNYDIALLFNIRLILNELHRKNVLFHQRELLIKNYSDIMDVNHLETLKYMDELSIIDLNKTIDKIWKDYFEGTESFVFQSRFMPRVDICLSGMFNPQNSEEIAKDINHVSDIFINLFPISDDESILLMGYEKEYVADCKQTFNQYFKESIKRVQRKITNLILFHCETWVCSKKLYEAKIKKCESQFVSAAFYFDGEFHEDGIRNEKRVFDMNIWSTNFISQMKSWEKIFVEV